MRQTNLCLRTVYCVFTLVCALIPSSVYASELAKGEKDTIFVGKLKVAAAVVAAAQRDGRALELQGVAESFEAQLLSGLSATRIFQVVERKRFRDIEEEQEFARVLADPGDRRAAQELKAAGAKFAFLPQIDGFSDQSSLVEHAAIGRSSRTRKTFLSALVQVVDTTTGALLPDVPSVQLTNVDEVVVVATALAGETMEPLVTLSKAVASRLAQDLVGILRPAKVLSVTGRQVQINRGSDAGFDVGLEVEVYATQDVKDEDTGEVFRNEVPVGRAKVVRNDRKQSFAMIEGDDLGIAPRCVVRVVGGGWDPTSSSASDRGELLTPGSSEKPLKW